MAIDLRSLSRRLAQPIDAATMACFRAAFGVMLMIETIWHWPIVERFYVQPRVHFTYPLAPFVKALPSPWMQVCVALVGVAAAGVALGLYYRLCAIVLFILYTYLLLIDQAYYNNHFYLCVLIAMWMAIASPHHLWSLDVMLKRVPRRDCMPAWPLQVLRAQWVMVYAFGALAKLNGDWLRGEPMRAFLQPHADTPMIGTWLTTHAAAMFFAWGGFLFDLLIGPALLYRRTRPVAIVCMVIFHVSNHFLFHIGIFPWFALASIVLFIDPSLPRRWFSKKRDITCEPFTVKPAVTWGIVIYLVIQLLLPLRAWVYPGHVSWTHEGWYFAWTMKLEAKDCFVGMQVIEPTTGRMWEVDQSRDLNGFQRHRMWQDPAMIAQYARHVRRAALQAGVREPRVIVDAVATLNGRAYQYMIDPHVALGQTKSNWPWREPWIEPVNVDSPLGAYVRTERVMFERVMSVIAAARGKPTADDEVASGN